MAVKNVLAFRSQDVKQSNHSAAYQLQNSILEVRNLLATLLTEIKEYKHPRILSDLRTLLAPLTIDNEEDDSDDSSDQ